MKNFISLPAFANESTNINTPALIAAIDSVNYLQLTVLGQPPSFKGDFTKVKAFSVQVGGKSYNYALPVSGDQVFDISGLVNQLFGAGFVLTDNTVINVNRIASIESPEFPIESWPDLINADQAGLVNLPVKFSDGHGTTIYFNTKTILPVIYFNTLQSKL